MDASVTSAGSDMLQAIDDSYGQRDDGRDRDTAIVRRDDMARIATLAGSMRNDIASGDRSAMKRNMSLMQDFLNVMRRDVNADRR